MIRYEPTAFLVVVLKVAVTVAEPLFVAPKRVRVARVGVVRVDAVIARISSANVLLPDATLFTTISAVETCTGARPKKTPTTEGRGLRCSISRPDSGLLGNVHQSIPMFTYKQTDHHI